MATRSNTASASSAPASPARKPARSARAAAPTAAKPGKKSAARPDVKALPAQDGKTGKPAKAPKAPKAAKGEDKAKKPKLVRDSFTIPKTEYEAIAALKLRAAKLGQTPKKSELLRAGLKALTAMGDAALLASLAAVPSIKTGRPAA